MRSPKSDTFYDLEFDQVLIEQSIAKQYGILPSNQGDLKYSDWSKMVGGLMNDTPLGQIVAIRSEKDRDVIRKFSKDQRRIRSEWQSFMAQKQSQTSYEDARKNNEQLERMIAGLFGKR